MAKPIVYYAHPGQQFSRANIAMINAARSVKGTTIVDLYAEYPRHDIDVPREQQRLLDHDTILFQFPLYWYSTPSLIKEWLDLVLQHGFAYGHEADKLTGKTMMLAVTAGGAEEAYTAVGYQQYPLRTFLTPLEQTARLCKMRFTAPYVLYGALSAGTEKDIESHASGYAALLTAICNDHYDFDAAEKLDVLSFRNLPINHTA